jgi:PAS domain S-box-containing protein
MPLRKLLDGSVAAMLAVGPDGTVLDASPAFEALTGRAKAPTQGNPVFDFVHREDRAGVMEALTKAIARPNECVRADFRILHADGSIRWVEATGKSMLEDAEIGAIVAHVHDITDRKRSEAALQSAVLQLERAQELGHVGSWVTYLDGSERVWWSNEACRIFGAQPEASTADFFSRVHPDDLARIVGLREAALADERRYELEFRIIRPDGELRWVYAAATVVRENGKPIRLEGLVRDISSEKRMLDQLRASEERYRRIVETTREGVWALDAESKTTFMNRRMLEMLGYEEQEVLGRCGLDFVAPEERAHASECLENRKLGLSEQLEIRLKRKNGTPLWVLLEGTPILDESGRYVGTLAMMADITERKRAAAALNASEERVRRSEAQLRQAQKMEAVGSLAAGVAHDFNNLLSVILSYSEILAQSLSPGDPMRADLEEIRSAGKRASDLTRQLLAFSRQQILQPKLVSLNDIVTGSEKMLRRLVGEDVQLSFVPDEMAGKVYADPGQIEQIIMNLVVNARDAMPEGGMLTIESSNVELDAGYAANHIEVCPGPYVMLAVTDSGSGMDPATQARIFEPFFTTKPKGKGTGLGLSTVFGIVRQSGGHISVYSEVGKGTTFKIYLPRVESTMDLEVRTSATPKNGLLVGSETVLVVEDDSGVRRAVRTILQKYGYQVVEAQNGGEAFLICEQHPETIDLLVTDVVMPRMNGTELRGRLAHLRPEMKVLFMSGYADRAIVHHGILEAGAAFIQKPVTPDALARKVREVLGPAPS